MTILDFLDNLSSHKGKFFLDNYVIRHKEMTSINNLNCCPLNVLCDGMFKNSSIDLMAEYLKLSMCDARKIVRAADNNIYIGDEDVIEIRKKLLELC